MFFNNNVFFFFPIVSSDIVDTTEIRIAYFAHRLHYICLMYYCT